MSNILAWGEGLVGPWLPTLLLVLFTTLLILNVFEGRPKNFPPGMMILPVVGSLLSMPFGPSVEMLRGLRKKYGDVASFAIFGNRVVMVSGPKLIKETFSRKNTADHPDFIFGSGKNIMITNGRTPNIGIIATNGQLWQEQQRFFLRHLSGLGLGKSTFESLITDEIAEFIDVLVKEGGRPIEMSHLFHRSVINVLWALVMGKRYPYSHARFNEMVKDFFVPADFNLLSPDQHIPHIFKVIEYIPTHRQGLKSLKKICSFIKEEIKEFMTNEELKNGDNFTALYLKEIEKKENPNFNLDMMEGVIVDMFMAGMETTSSTLTTSMYLLGKHPHVQRRVHEELDEVVGKERCPSFYDMESLPYVKATIQEMQRTFNLPKFSLPHITNEDCKIGGYDIPKGTWLLTNLDDSHKNPEYWKNSNEFDPQNFLDENGKYKWNNAFMPFGTGKRICTGEQVAKQTLFLFFTHVMQKFNVTLVKEHSPIDDTSPLFTRPPRYTASFTSRSTCG
uniref:Cytochrome P450 n=2 Tax=Scylla olivacea TaxID=85551 RepID=A0A0P4WJ61_SCYOL